MIHSFYNYFLTRKANVSKRSLGTFLYWKKKKFIKNALIRYYTSVSADKLRLNPESNVVVSLTSFPARIKTVHIVIKSLFNQKYKPKKIVLWLAKEQFPNFDNDLPKNLLDLKTAGLEIKYCDDLRPHKKYFYAFQEYKNDLIVTADDDVLYPNRMLEKLVGLHKEYPGSVIANRVREMRFIDNELQTYRSWKINKINHAVPSKKLFATGVAGVLYKPGFFSESLYDKEKMMQLAKNDDIWLKAGTLINNVPVAFTNYYFKDFIDLPSSREESLFSQNVFNNDNDLQIKEVFDFFRITAHSFEEQY